MTQWYSDTAHDHAVTHLGGNRRFWYDLNGNMLTRVEMSGSQRITYTQQWDVENRLTVVTNTVTSQVSRFAYDGDGMRVRQVNLSGTKVYTTAYVGGLEVLITGTQRITRTYYSAGAQLVAMRVVTSTGGNTLYFLHTDHLGSASLTTNSSGVEVARQKYYPFGAIRPGNIGTMPTDKAFTSQYADATGLYFFNARYYSGAVGRFISADTIVPGAGNPQAWNRYAYVQNNPLRFTDPSGHSGTECAATGPYALLCVAVTWAVENVVIPVGGAILTAIIAGQVDLSAVGDAVGEMARVTVVALAPMATALTVGALDDMGPDYPLPMEYMPGAIQATYPLPGTNTLATRNLDNRVGKSTLKVNNLRYVQGLPPGKRPSLNPDPEDFETIKRAARLLGKIGAVSITGGLVARLIAGKTDENPNGPNGGTYLPVTIRGTLAFQAIATPIPPRIPVYPSPTPRRTPVPMRPPTPVYQ